MLSLVDYLTVYSCIIVTVIKYLLRDGRLREGFPEALARHGLADYYITSNKVLLFKVNNDND